MRMPVVEYGDGNVKVPRCGRNAATSPADSFGLRPAPVDESMNPPAGFDCAQTMFCDAAMKQTAPHRSETNRRVPKSMLPPRSSGPAAEGTLPPFSRCHCFGNLWEPQGLASGSAHVLTSHARRPRGERHHPEVDRGSERLIGKAETAGGR